MELTAPPSPKSSLEQSGRVEVRGEGVAAIHEPSKPQIPFQQQPQAGAVLRQSVKYSDTPSPSC